MPDSEKKHEFNIVGTVKLNDDKISMDLSGVRVSTQERRTISHSDQRASTLDHSRGVGFKVQSEHHQLGKNGSSNQPEEMRSLKEKLVFLLLELPGVNEQKSEKRDELFRYLPDSGRRREARKMLREEDNPENDIRGLVDYVIDLEQIGPYISLISCEIEDTDLRKRFAEWSIAFRDRKREKSEKSKGEIRRNLYNEMLGCFNLSEIDDLCFLLGIPKDEIEGARLGTKIQELITYQERRGEMDSLIFQLVKLRSHVDWEMLRQ